MNLTKPGFSCRCPMDLKNVKYIVGYGGLRLAVRCGLRLAVRRGGQSQSAVGRAPGCDEKIIPVGRQTTPAMKRSVGTVPIEYKEQGLRRHERRRLSELSSGKSDDYGEFWAPTVGRINLFFVDQKPKNLKLFQKLPGVKTMIFSGNPSF